MATLKTSPHHTIFHGAAGTATHGMYAAGKKSAPPAQKPPLGSGARFAALKADLATKGNVADPAALAAAIGRKKYGAKKFAALSAKGRAGK